ncbi:hypothetical protein RI129_008293 [Pyrocoelia pectoralis]|uniref:Uncharacterized protein n=1 Tax=Pyrocoelia pectoralis TaxID=417401 RepID=A0AAN7ZK84_9COLE
MNAEDLTALKTHGYVFDSDSGSGGSRSDLDDEYYKLKPPPIQVDNFQFNIVRIPCSTQEINVNTNRSFNLVNSKTEILPHAHTSICQNVVNGNSTNRRTNSKKNRLLYSQVVSAENIPPTSTSTPQNSRTDSSTKKFDTNMNNSDISIINKNVPFLLEYCKNVSITKNHPSSTKIITNGCEIVSETTRKINKPRVPQQHNYNLQLRKDNVNLSDKRTRNNNNNTPAPLHRVITNDLHVPIRNTNTQQNDTTQPPETKTNCFNTLLMCFCCCCQ